MVYALDSNIISYLLRPSRNQGVDPATVSKRLGHANVAITMKTYTHAIKEHDRVASDKLGNLIKKKK